MRDRERLATSSDGFASELQAAIVRAASLKARAGGALAQETLFLQAFQELDTAHEELRETEAQLHARADDLANALADVERQRMQAHALFDEAPEAYLVSDGAGKILRVNRRVSDLLQIDARFLVQKPLIGFVDRADRSAFFEMITRAGPSGAPVRRELLLKPRGARSAVPCIASVSRATGSDADGALRWMLCELVGETPARAAESPPFPSHETARMLTQVSQELRTNLSSVSGWLQVARENMSELEGSSRAIASITRAVRNSIGIAERLAEYARLEHSDAALACEHVALAELVGRLIEEMRLTALQRGFRLSGLLSSGLPPIVGDPVQLSRAMSTLVLDFARTTAPGGELSIVVAQAGSGACVIIRSSGCGVDLAVLRDSEPGAPVSALDPGVARARRCLERHGATIHRQAARSDGHSSMEICFPGPVPG